MLSFIAPIWLIALPVTATLLLYVYLRNGKNKQNKISSLFFIKQVTPSLARGKKKISLPWRLLFEILVVFSIIAALSGVFINNTSEQAIIVIDNSASMGALLSPGENKDTLLDEAKRSAQSNLELFSEIKQASVWVTNPEPREITAGFVSSKQAKDTIASLTIGFGIGNVTSLLPRLSKNASKILVFSDQFAQSQQEQNNKLINLIPLNLQNPIRENIAIESISVDGTLDKLSSQMTVKIKAYLQKQANCLISISKFENNQWSTLASKDVTFVGTEEREVLFNLDNSSEKERTNPLKAQIKECSPNKVNALNLDDSAWIAPSQEHSNIILVSDFSSRELGLDRISGAKIDSIKPKEWQTLAIEENKYTDNNALIIFHRFMPKRLPQSNALFISPPEGSSLFNVNKIDGNAHLVRWEANSNLLKYLSLPNLDFKGAVQFSNLPAWSNALMFSSTGPIAIYGNLSQKRYVALGFEILPFEGKKNPFLSILTLNSIKWLSKAEDEQGSSNLLKINLKNKAETVTLVDSVIPNSLITTSPNGESVSLQYPGMIEATYKDTHQIVAANFFSPNESNLREPGFISIPKVNAKETERSSAGIPLEVYLILIALAVLLVDSCLFLYRKQTFKRRSNAL